jgi:hypothetical protein
MEWFTRSAGRYAWRWRTRTEVQQLAAVRRHLVTLREDPAGPERTGRVTLSEVHAHPGEENPARFGDLDPGEGIA